MTYKNGIIMRFRASDINVDISIVTVSSLNEKPVYKNRYRCYILKGGELQKDGIYELVYNSTLTRSLDDWYLLNLIPKNTF